ncbi:MAG: maltose alpha-D-glucosyltransferase [Bryobacteraceae bacterium]|nr:maltose alpha-D-glucosyltransferase [Bryobacteraceae bacterium]
MKKPGSAQDPLWYKDAIIYETHVKAFFDSNNDGIGDFQGLLQKLDYLQDLGVTCLWLLPFFPSPLRDDGYDIADYNNVHPSYGTLEDFRKFVDVAHERNMQVLIEMVVNHTSDEHPWFQAARKAPPGSPDRDFYVWSDTDQKYSGTRIIFTDTEKSNWTWDPEAKAYFWHRFFSHQPDLNFDNPAVLDEIVNAMRFWLDMGVDAMRLDAIPYLVERENTNCENLPETHAVIKHIRRELDAHYENRMLLAEANQWPTDVRPYFGDSDECHMAFHFPLMPRLFMSLRLEDRHPITEIMSQTPEIPSGCQWGLFLRNHDELTLEMVTDEERDYMYFAYSADPRMRVNVGIRRRLAPLMENNPRRIELLNSILFSFPGTPIIYYGDEIGMGDNIYLGDRNGVRTPMQWSADRNGGFSRANPARLYHPLIMDPVYGYEAINVEAQQGDPSSLLNWMRNMIGLRKLFRVFSRGTLEFLHPRNRKILAYVRKYQGEQVLCVANLSRFPQPGELDLSEFAGMQPVEMLGYTEFPPIRKEPYPLTLGAYGFYWFELQPGPAPIEVESADQGLAVVEHSWESVFEGYNRERLEQRALPRFIAGQRWFGGKARTLQSARIRDWAPFPDGDSHTALVIAEVGYADGGREEYLLSLAIRTGADAAAIENAAPGAIVSKLSASGEPGILFDAVYSEESWGELLEAIEQRLEIPAAAGSFRAIASSAYQEARGPADAPLKVQRSSAEQSNTSIRYGDRLILKLFRKLESGPNPDYEIGRYLTEEAGFNRIPKLAGWIEYSAAGRGEATVAMLQALVENQGDGWQWTLDELGRYYERCSASGAWPQDGLAAGARLLELADAAPPRSAVDMIAFYLEAAAVLGKRTAQMHRALSEATDPAFVPEPLGPAERAELALQFQEHAAKVLDALKAKLASLADDIIDRAGYVVSLRRRLLGKLTAVAKIEEEAARIRIHGDYHLGQVLSVEHDFFIIDFEGEPARPLAERRQKQSPLKDVAGMLRSFSYAAYSGWQAYVARRPEEAARMEAWATHWERWSAAAFLKAYREGTEGCDFAPRHPEPFEKLLDAFLLDKALYEIHYELNNRPDWVRIPLVGLLSLLGER